MAGLSAEPDLRALLAGARTIAVVGASTDPWRPSHGISGLLKRAGYRMIPVNPNETGSTLHGEPFVSDLAAIGQPVDIVNVFRRSDALPALVEDAIAAGAKALWTQLGVRHEAAAARARQAGLAVVMNRCISVEWGRLMR